MTAASFADVSVTSPLPASASGSPVHFVASASSSRPVTAMRIYVDDVSVFETANSTLDTFVAMATGVHSVVVQAWDAGGTVLKFPETVTVTGGISVSSPADGFSGGSPLRGIASSSADPPISQMVIYLDHNNIFITNCGN